MNEPRTFGDVKDAYLGEARELAARSMAQVATTRVTPDMLSLSGVVLSAAAAVSLYFVDRAWWLYLVAGALFVLGAVCDILDGALARAGGKGTPFGAFLDSTLDRLGEAFVLGAAALVFAREGMLWAVAIAFAAIVGSFLVSYTRAKAESLGLKGDVGFGSRLERVAILGIGLGLGSVGGLPWAIVALTAMAWITVVQRILFVRKQLLERGASI
jgi:CDP-diacylglycerol--glycerol-3-phosphate 3-phosphatidyltransferase